jgi:hypothetical protein
VTRSRTVLSQPARLRSAIKRRRNNGCRND